MAHIQRWGSIAVKLKKRQQIKALSLPRPYYPLQHLARPRTLNMQPLELLQPLQNPVPMDLIVRLDSSHEKGRDLGCQAILVASEVHVCDLHDPRYRLSVEFRARFMRAEQPTVEEDLGRVE